jgi:hypothetical protein
VVYSYPGVLDLGHILRPQMGVSGDSFHINSWDPCGDFIAHGVC